MTAPLLDSSIACMYEYFTWIKVTAEAFPISCSSVNSIIFLYLVTSIPIHVTDGGISLFVIIAFTTLATAINYVAAIVWPASFGNNSDHSSSFSSIILNSLSENKTLDSLTIKIMSGALVNT